MPEWKGAISWTAGRREAIERNADLLAPVLEREVTIVTGFAEDAGGEDPGYSEKNRNVVEKIYLGIVFSFVLTLVLAGNSWARSRTQRIQVEKMLGLFRREDPAFRAGGGISVPPCWPWQLPGS